MEKQTNEFEIKTKEKILSCFIILRTLNQGLLLTYQHNFIFSC
jgi:hypothetical protein